MYKNVVAQFIDTGAPGGAETLMIELCTYCSLNDFSPIVFHFDHPWIKKTCESLNIEECSLGHKGHYKRNLTLPFFARRFAALLDQHKVSLLHSHLFGPIVAGALAARMSGVPHIATLHDTHVIEERASRRHLLKMAEALGTDFVAVGEKVRHFYTSTCGLNESRVHKIYNGVVVPEPDRSIGEQKRSSLGIPLDAIVCACVGRIVAIKRVDLIIRAFMMAASQRSCYLLVVGDGPEREIYEALVPPDFLERVIFLGQRTDVSELLCSTDVFIQYSTSEGLSLSILEAMAHGVACIVSDVGGNSELIQSGQSGFLVDPNNLDLLESRLREVISNAGLRKYIAEGARSRAGEFFELDSCLNAYMMVYSRRLQHG